MIGDVWLITLIGSLGAVGAATAAGWAAKQARKAVLAQVLMGIMDIYDSSKMLSAREKLDQWKERYGPDFDKKFGEKYRTPELKPYDEARRMYFHYFERIKNLLDCGLVTKSHLRKVIQRTRVHIFLELVEPLEPEVRKARCEEEYDYSIGDAFRRIFGISARET